MEFSFEKSMNRLEEISSLLENNEITLDEAMTVFEEGLLLIKQCEEKLKNLENRINTIIVENSND